MDNTPSSVLKTLVEKLKRDLQEKERKVKAMGRAVQDLKQELMAQNEVVGEEERRGKKERKVESDETEKLKRRIEDLVQRNNKLQKQVHTACIPE